MDLIELAKALKLPEASVTANGMERDWDGSLNTFGGLPEYLTMPFVREYFGPGWVNGDAALLPLFERTAAIVAKNRELQLYAHHSHRALFVNDGIAWSYGAWPRLNALLGEDLCGIFDFMIAMSAIPLWCATHRKMGIPERYSRASANWLKGTMRIYNSAHPGCHGIDRSQTYWLRFNIDGKLFRIGRFEYMADSLEKWTPPVFRSRTDGRVTALCGDNWGLLPDGSRMFNVKDEAAAPLHTKFETDADGFRGTFIRPDGFAVPGDVRTLKSSEYAPVFSEGDLVPGMHIPGGGGMTLDEAYKSWNEALEFFPKYLGREVKGICCRSWIFNPSFERELPDSNLAKLMREVYLFPEMSYGRDGAFFIFGRSDGDFSNYPNDNSVRRAFHRIVEKGELLKTGGMFVLPEEIRSHNCKRYRSMN